MKVGKQRFGTVEVLSPDGPITVEEGEEFAAAMEGQMTSANPRVVVNMEEVPYLDSYGLELMLNFANDLRNRGLPLKLSMVTPTCREIMELTELTSEFEMFDEIEDAVRSYL
ncbi:MAG: hypothetical protein HJJLKODD_00501 [Phycisphaerae bacterium]|nr:hypothetical protein [Phycisphaerae bacterium]